MVGLLALAVVSAITPTHAKILNDQLAVLQRGINVTHWFRFPSRQDPSYLRSYLDDATLSRIKQAGFTFVRLAVQPELVRDDAARLAALTTAVDRIERQGLGVVVGWHPQMWHLESSAHDRAELKSLWERLAARLQHFDTRLTFPEILNEPVFGDAKTWEALQQDVLASIRRRLPRDTVILTGEHWGAIDGLLALMPVADDNVVYSFHTYEPPVLTTLGAFDTTIDRRAIAQLPFPVVGESDCDDADHTAANQHTRDVIQFYCSQRWTPAKLSATIRAVGDWSRQHHVAVIAGEFGASSDLRPKTRMAWISAMRIALEQEGIGWALWGYDDSMGFDIHPDQGMRELDPDLLRALGLHGPH